MLNLCGLAQRQVGAFFEIGANARHYPAPAKDCAKSSLFLLF